MEVFNDNTKHNKNREIWNVTVENLGVVQQIQNILAHRLFCQQSGGKIID